MVENKNEIIEWIINNQEKYEISITEITGLKNYLPNISDFSVKMKFNGYEFVGRGTSFSSDNALLKAFSECVERIALDFYNIELSSGMAVHPSLEQAKENAKNELIEHDSFLCNFLLGRKLFEIQNLDIKVKDGMKIKSYLMFESKVGHSVMVIVQSDLLEIGLASGTSFEKSLNHALEKATIEALRSFDFAISQSNLNSITIDSFMSLNIYSHKSHQQLARNNTYSELFFKSLSNPQHIDLSYIDENFSVNTLSLDFLDSKIPLFLTRAQNSTLQSMYLGPTIDSKINFSRLKQITRDHVININYLPHPFD